MPLWLLSDLGNNILRHLTAKRERTKEEAASELQKIDSTVTTKEVSDRWSRLTNRRTVPGKAANHTDGYCTATQILRGDVLPSGSAII